MSEQDVEQVPQVVAPEVEVLRDLGIEPDEQGRIPLTDHAKLLTTVKALREQVKASEAAVRKVEKQTEEQRLAAMSEQERAVEDARKAGYEAALAEQRGLLVRSQVTAAAAAAGFADPADAAGFLPLDELDGEAAVSAAVKKLAEQKPYLVRQQKQFGALEQGQRGGETGDGDPNAWLKKAIKR